MRPVILSVAILALACTFSTKAWAALAFYEGFDYAAGDLVGNTNPFTSTAWSGGVTDTVTSPGMTYDDLATTGNAATGVAGGTNVLDGLTQVQTLFAQESGTVYLTGMISGEASRAWYKCIGAGCTGDQSLWFQSFGGNVNVGIHGIGGEATPSLGAQAAGGATNLVAIKIDFAVGNDTVSGVLNPDLSLGEPTFPVLSSSFDLNGADWTAFHVNSDAGVINDEFRVGTTWADVAVPEPGSLALLALGSLAMMGIRASRFRSRRRRC